jgi:hypothetical protein
VAQSAAGRLAAAALLSGAAVTGAAGCAGAHRRPAALRLERTDLVRIARTLRQLQAPAGGEVAAARGAWPALAGGLPSGVSPAVRLSVSAAVRRAAALTLPAFVATEGDLTGPAAKLGGMLKAYARLTQRGWQFTAAALAAESASATSGSGSAARATSTGATTTQAARFLRSNAALYIYCIYDGHYNLSLIGRALQSAYHTLGGASAFGGSLTQAQVDALAGAYSIASTRLTPHPPPSLVV